MKYVEKFFKYLFNLIIVFLVIIAIILMYTLFQIHVLNKDYINIFGYSFFQVETGSMVPTIQIDDIVIVKITDKIGKDDIIAFKQDNNIITHRIIEINDDQIVTKGDANNAIDEKISSTQVVGKVVHTLKNIGVWTKVFQTPRVYICIIATILLFGISFSIKEEKINKE